MAIMLRGRRVGTLTAGIMLIVFGLLFLGRFIFPILEYSFILSLWPLVLLFLGIEVIVSYFVNKEEKVRYDGGALVLIILLAVFAMIMGGIELLLDYIKSGRLMF